jgi:hypothetical protein
MPSAGHRSLGRSFFHAESVRDGSQIPGSVTNTSKRLRGWAGGTTAASQVEGSE